MTTVSDNEPDTPYYYCVCPSCLRPTADMEFSEKQHVLTEAEAEQVTTPEYAIFALIGNEVLLCPCGRELTWFDMMLMKRV